MFRNWNEGWGCVWKPKLDSNAPICNRHVNLVRWEYISFMFLSRALQQCIIPPSALIVLKIWSNYLHCSISQTHDRKKPSDAPPDRTLDAVPRKHGHSSYYQIQRGMLHNRVYISQACGKIRILKSHILLIDDVGILKMYRTIILKYTNKLCSCQS